MNTLQCTPTDDLFCGTLLVQNCQPFITMMGNNLNETLQHFCLQNWMPLQVLGSTCTYSYAGPLEILKLDGGWKVGWWICIEPTDGSIWDLIWRVLPCWKMERILGFIYHFFRGMVVLPHGKWKIGYTHSAIELILIKKINSIQ